jgi:hypothetical protein
MCNARSNLISEKHLDLFFEQNTVGELPTAQLNKREFMYKQEREGGARREATIDKGFCI